MRLPEGLDAPTVWRHMADHRILIRDCANFTGLSDAFIRISLKTEAENRRATDLLVRLSRSHATPGPHER
jgi:threonine-phosphate decarboxylase